MSVEKRLSRRHFLRGAAMTAAGLVAASCAAPTPIVVEKEVAVEKVVKETVVVEKEVAVEKIVKETVVQQKEISIEKMVTATAIPSKFNEAPELAAKVKAGQLPPVEDRVPLEPLVIAPWEEIGTYGGVFKQLHLGASDKWQNSYILFQRIAKYSFDFTEVVPNVARAWEFSGDGKDLTLYYRRGMKWSDGKDFTADDTIFWWEDNAMNKELTPSAPSRYNVGGELAVVTKIDDYTVKFSFAKAYGSLEDFLPAETPWNPAHFMKKFHPKYASQAALDGAMKAADMSTWTDLYGSKLDYLNAPGTPTLHAWNCTNTLDQPVQIFERNPYFWKVDSEGNQLPYLDRMERTLVPDAEALLLKAIAGECSWQARRVGTLPNRPVVVENEAKGGYRVLQVKSPGTNWGTLNLNFGSKDTVLAELFKTLDFRIALSVAIDREEMNQLLLKGLGYPGQATCAIGSPWFEEEFLTNYAQYDPAMANELLDKLGLDKRDSAGFRLRPDGARLSIINSVFGADASRAELYKKYWGEVGIENIVKPLDNALWVPTVHGLEHDVAEYAANLGFWGNPPMVRETFPVTESGGHWAPSWALWYQTKGAEGEEPPADIKRLQAIFEEVKAEVSAAKRTELQKEALALHAKNIWMIGFAAESDAGRYGIAPNNFRNVPTESFDIETIHPSTFFIKG